MLMQLFETIKKNKKWSNYRLAKELGIPQTSLNHYMNQPASTREKMLIKLQEVSGLSVDDFWVLLKKEVKK